MSAPEFNQQVHLIDYLNIIRRRKWVVITFLLVVVCIVAYKTYNTTPVYKAATKILVEGQSFTIDEMKDIANPYFRQGDATKLELLQSRSLAGKIIEDMRLREYFANRTQKKPDFLTLALYRVKKYIRNLLSKPTSDAKETRLTLLGERSESEHVFKSKIQDKVVSLYLSKLDVMTIPDTKLIDIRYEDESPEMAALVANAHARLFIERSIQAQNDDSMQALNWLKKQLNEQKLKMEKAKLAISEYKYKQLGSLSIDDDIVFTFPEIEQNSVIQDSRNQLVELKAQKLVMSSKLGSKHPKIVEISSSIERFKQEIIDQMQQIRKSIKTELDRNVVAEDSIQQTQGLLQQQVAVLPTEESVNYYYMLRLEEESEREIYDILLKQSKEIDLTGNMENENFRIVDTAEIPRRPFKPNVFNNFLLSVVMGLALGIGLAFFIEYMTELGTTPEETMRHLGIPVIGVLPYDKLLKGNKPLALPLSSSQNKQKKRGKYYATYNISASLATSLPLKRSRKAGQVFMVESATANEGKSTVLAKSAVSLAKGGLRVVMVDADLQRPTLHKIFGINNDETGGLVNAKESILSHKILKGSLDEYSLDDLFSLIALRSQSGRLVITNNTQVMTAVFENGHLFQLQSNEIPFDNRLGTMLLRGGFITESQLKDALARNKRTEQPLGYILINAGYINQDKLRGPVKLQMEECIHKLFSWKQGTFVFEQGNIETYEDKRIYFQEDYFPIIKRLGRTTGSRFLEKEILSYVKSVDEPNLSLLTAGMGDEYECEGLLHHAVVTEIINILRQHFDVVLVDAPPVLEAMGSVKPLASLSDGIIFVVKSGNISIRNIKDATEYLKENKSKIIGTILNQVKVGGGYYYGRYY